MYYGTPNGVLVYFNSVIKCIKQCCCTLILLPKSTLNANLTTTNRFFTNDDWQHRRFENFESDHQYESNLESDVRFEIESNHEGSQVPTERRRSSLTAAVTRDVMKRRRVSNCRSSAARGRETTPTTEEQISTLTISPQRVMWLHVKILW